MTIESSLRKRAAKAQRMATIWISLAVTMLVLAFMSLPHFADRALLSANQVETVLKVAPSEAKVGSNNSSSIQFFAVTVVGLGLAMIAFGCHLLGHNAFLQIELATRLSGLADALCIAGKDMTQLEKAVEMFVPEGRYLSPPEIISEKNIKALGEVAKELRTKP